MADVFLAAMAGVTAADQRANLEKLSYRCTRLGVTTAYHQSAPPGDAASTVA